MRQRRHRRLHLPLHPAARLTAALRLRMWDYYKLVGREAVPCGAADFLAMQGGASHIDGGDTVIGNVRVSTVFLGFDHNFGRLLGGPTTPILFETMVFGAPEDCPELSDAQQRYSTYDEAEAGHAHYCALVRTAIDQPLTP